MHLAWGKRKTAAELQKGARNETNTREQTSLATDLAHFSRNPLENWKLNSYAVLTICQMETNQLLRSTTVPGVIKRKIFLLRVVALLCAVNGIFDILTVAK